MPRLVSVGNVVVDLVLTVPALPERGGDVVARSADLVAGGGLNTLVAARRDGLPVLFAGRRGTGPFGDVVARALRDEGVETLLEPSPDVDSGYCVALVDDGAERTFVTHVGAEGRLTADDLTRIEFSPGDTVFVSGYGLAHPVNARSLCAWLPTVPAEVRVVLDVSPLVADLDRAVLDAVLLRADVVTANAREARLLVPGRDLAEAAAVIATRCRGGAVVRDGADGCWVADGEGVAHVSGFRVEAVDTNGAGDAHDGVLVAALSRGASLRSAARRANAAAALAVTGRGPATAPTGEEIDALLQLPPPVAVSGS